MAFLAAGSFGGWAWFAAALLYVGAFAALLDRMLPRLLLKAPVGAEFPGSEALLVFLALCHLALWPVAVAVIAGRTGFGPAGSLLAFFAFGLTFGQISNPVAHELIHRGDRRLFWLGVAVYATMLFAHHASAHRLVHHVHVGSDGDPNSARRGETVWHFLPRAWIGSFRAGYAAETRLRQGRGLHPYMVYLGLSALSLLLSAAIAGWIGLAVHLALALHVTSQLLISDYVQHYGLRRALRGDGRLEPVAERHSWNAPQWFSGKMMLHAPRHSDHHAHPSRPYPGLRLPDAAPMLPRGLPLMGALALVPPLWFRVMDRRLDRLASRESEGAGLAP